MATLHNDTQYSHGISLEKGKWASWFRVFRGQYEYKDFRDLSSALGYAKLVHGDGCSAVRVRGQYKNGYWYTLWENGVWVNER